MYVSRQILIEDIDSIEEVACLFGDIVELVGEVLTETIPNGQLSGGDYPCLPGNAIVLSRPWSTPSTAV